MQSVEAAAKSRKEAIQNALDELGVELHEVEIEILDEGSRGFLGLGSRNVVVRVTAQGLPDRPAKAKPAPKHEQKKRPAREPKRASEPPAKKKRAPREPKPAPVSEANAEETAALLAEMIQRMGIEAKVTTADQGDGTTRLLVSSEDSALLIGRKGRNLNAMQYLINRMFLTGTAQDGPERILVDIEGYQDRRRQSLEEMARHLARRAKESGREMRVKPLNPQERRIVHVCLQDDPDVRTFSLGDSLMRTVVISPKNGNDDANRNRPRRARGGGGPRTENAPDKRSGRRDGS